MVKFVGKTFMNKVFSRSYGPTLPQTLNFAHPSGCSALSKKIEILSPSLFKHHVTNCSLLTHVTSWVLSKEVGYNYGDLNGFLKQCYMKAFFLNKKFGLVAWVQKSIYYNLGIKIWQMIESGQLSWIY